MIVSLCIIAYNEEKVIKNLLEQVKLQDYPHKNTEIVLVDSCSSDNTKKILLDFADENNKEYISVKVLDNTKRNQASGWNKAISNSFGDVIIRVDAHAEIPSDFISKNIALINEGEYVCGGSRPSKVDEPTNFKNMLFLAESSMFGSAFAGYRREINAKKYVNSVFHGAYRREVFEKVGGFNEDLGRTEDNELHYRIRKSGYKICQSSDIISYQHIRGTFSSMLKQKYGNGKWIGLTLGVCPKCLSIFHFVPFCFVGAMILSLVFMSVGIITGIQYWFLPIIILMSLYILTDILMTAMAIIHSEKHLIQLMLPFVFFILHCAYGLGTIIGIAYMPIWKLKRDDSAETEIENVKKCVKENSGRI